MNIYNVDWDVLAEEYLPEALRKPINLIWVKSAFSQIENLYIDFMAFRAKCLYRIVIIVRFLIWKAQ